MKAQQLDKGIKDELKNIIEHVLEPIQGRIVEFSNPYKLRYGSKYGNEEWKTWEDIEYPIIIDTQFGRKVLNVSFLHIKQASGNAWKICQDLVYSGLITKDKRQEVLERLYNPKLLDLINDSKKK